MYIDTVSEQYYPSLTTLEVMMNTLVAYFSATGTTAGCADTIAKTLGADLYEIKPSTPYSSADLDWTNRKSRSSVEMNDPNSRPEISAPIDSIGKYDTIFIGFPVWWYVEPHIIDTFLESYDFSGKRIIPFCTSGGSGIDKAVKSIKRIAGNAEVENGGRVSAGNAADFARRYI